MRYEHDAMKAVDARIRTVWDASNDVLLLSQARGHEGARGM